MAGVYLMESKDQFIVGFALKSMDNLSEIEIKLLTLAVIHLASTETIFVGQRNQKT